MRCLVVFSCSLLGFLQIKAQHSNAFFDFSEGLNDNAQTSIIHNDTLYILNQAGSQDEKRVQIIKMFENEVIEIKQIVGPVDFEYNYNQMIASQDYLYLVFPEGFGDDSKYILQQRSLKDLELIAESYYKLPYSIEYFYYGGLVEFKDNIIIYGAAKGHGDRGIGLMYWIDPFDLSIDTLINFKESSTTKVSDILNMKSFNDELICVNAIDDYNIYEIRTYNEEKELTSKERINTITLDSAPDSNFEQGDPLYIANNKNILMGYTGPQGLGVRVVNIHGEFIRHLEPEVKYFYRYYDLRNISETEYGEIILTGNASSAINFQDPYAIPDSGFIPEIVVAPFVFKYDKEKLVFSHNYIILDNYKNSKAYTLSQLHETSNTDLIGVGIGNPIANSFQVGGLWEGDIWILNANSTGCLEESDCDENTNLYFLTDNDEINDPLIELVLFPNPVCTTLNIRSNSTKNHTLEIISSTGQFISTVELGANSTQEVKISALNSGIYYLKYYNAKSTRLLKFAKI